MMRLPLAIAAAAVATPSQDAATPPRVTAMRGIAGAVEFDAAGPRIRAGANQSITSPIIVRIGDAKPAADGKTHYRVEFIGAYAGDHDLRPYLEREDGSALDLPPLTVTILSQLTPDHGTDLFSSTDSTILRPSVYRAGMIALGVLWAGAPIAYFVVRAARRRKVEPPAPAAPPPSFADQLRPLVQAAISGSLSIAERGRLELLLYLYWRGRLGLEGRQADVISRLRMDTQAGALLRAVERWLHARRGPDERPDSEVASLLEPYRHEPAIAEAPITARGGAA
jgi:hypothetical protein